MMVWDSRKSFRMNRKRSTRNPNQVENVKKTRKFTFFLFRLSLLSSPQPQYMVAGTVLLLASHKFVIIHSCTDCL